MKDYKLARTIAMPARGDLAVSNDPTADIFGLASFRLWSILPIMTPNHRFHVLLGLSRNPNRLYCRQRVRRKRLIFLPSRVVFKTSVACFIEELCSFCNVHNRNSFYQRSFEKLRENDFVRITI